MAAVTVIAQLQACYSGDADGFIEWLAQFIAAGVQHVILRFGTLEEPRRTIERAANDVLPRMGRRFISTDHGSVQGDA